MCSQFVKEAMLSSSVLLEAALQSIFTLNKASCGLSPFHNFKAYVGISSCHTLRGGSNCFILQLKQLFMPYLSSKGSGKHTEHK
jgi:hypothetical protein